MTIRILEADKLRSVNLQPQRISPVEAELRIFFEMTEPINASVRGNLCGPTCPYASTIELAYPPAPIPGWRPETNATIAARIIIPEPSRWDPIAPFLYSGRLELLAHENRLVHLEIRTGICAWQTQPKRLIWNGQALQLRAIQTEEINAGAAAALRDRGVNTIVIPLQSATQLVFETADRYGFLVLVELRQEPEILGSHWFLECTSFLGCVFDSRWSQIPERFESATRIIRERHRLIGIRGDDPCSFVHEVDFILFRDSSSYPENENESPDAVPVELIENKQNLSG